MGKRRRESDESQAGGEAEAAPEPPADPPAEAAPAEGAPAEDEPQPASPADAPKPLSLKIRLALPHHDADAAPPEAFPDSAELVKMRRRGRPSDEPAAEEPPPPADEPREKRPSKRHKPDPELAAPSPPAKKEGGKKDKKAAATVPAEDASADAKAVFLGLLDAVRAQVSPDGRLMAGIFEKLPSKKELPDYYVVIDNPIDLKTIQAKIAKDGYAGIKELKADMDLMFGNAKKYNMPGSDIYKDAVALQKFFNAQAAGVKVSGGASAGGDAPKEKTLKITLKRAESGTEEKPAGDKKRKDGKKEEVKEEKKEDDKKPAILRKKLSDKDIGIYFKALHDDDEAEVVRFLSPPINVNPGRLFQATLDRQMFKWTAMQAAAYYGSVKAIRALAKAGANVEQQDEWYGGRALAWACYGDHADVARVLMEELGADKNAQNNGGQVAWELVPNKGAEKWRGLMIDEKEWQKIRDEIIARDGTAEPKPPPNVPHPNALKSKTLLSEDALKMHEILKADDLERFKQFVTDYHLDVNANQTTRELGEAFKWGPLHAACYFGSAKCARFLLEKGAKVEQADLGFGSRPLAWAVYADKVEIAKMLVHEFGADKDARNGLDKRALDMAEDPQDPKWKEVFEDKTKLRIKFKMGEDDDDDMGASPAPVSAGAPGAYFPPGAQPGQPPRYGLPQAAGGQPPMPIKRPPGRPPSRPPAPYPGFQPGGGGYSPYPGTPGMPGAGTPYMQGPRPPNAFYPPGGYPPQPYNPYSAGAGFGPRPPAPGSLYPRPPVPGPRPPPPTAAPPPKLTLYVQRPSDRPLISAVELRAGSWSARVPASDLSVALASVVLPPACKSLVLAVHLAPGAESDAERKVQLQLNGTALAAPKPDAPAKRGGQPDAWRAEVGGDALREGSNMLECVATEKVEGAKGGEVSGWRTDSFMVVGLLGKAAPAAA